MESAHLELFCDYGAEPLWRRIDGVALNVDLDQLGLSGETKLALRDWAGRFEDITWPPDQRPDPDETTWTEFLSEGERLRDAVQTELGDNIEVVLGHG
jgi:hypothetical protein